ncbi:hypothetical protein SAMN05216249_105103 [Acetitomaculum ruminis DSM 5522]|uniref:4-amino-4-deoxy-L-arabinose transferase n=1 Tax=Acetitomaculum ruminis DSM 5522 TaxID=1120918 RepID=A0A1I0X193_9FIRM|nr:hypothetical protein [Acetitomaculum ruminis]SFA94170.1 hypothetical protein SAMN05216249_105103 [Acetitomaculum ruminis DSM 5522]
MNKKNKVKEKEDIFKYPLYVNILVIFLAVFLGTLIACLFTFRFNLAENYHYFFDKDKLSAEFAGLNLLGSKMFWIRTLFAIIVMHYFLMHFICKVSYIYNWLFDKRYFVGAGIWAAATLLNLNGSSIGAWGNYLGIKATEPIYGVIRYIRSDEWAVFTPMIFSQSYGDAYSWFSNIIRGDLTDVFIIYALPVKNIMSIIFRPFLNGYMLFGNSLGMGFFWVGRIVCLYLVWLELFMLLTKKDKRLSAIGALFVAVSPQVQWWFAINGLVEMLIFGALAILLVNTIMKTTSKIIKFFCFLGLYICAGGYLLTLYPAWMVPLFYVFLGLMAYVIILNIKDYKISLFDIAGLAVTIVLFGVSMYYIYTVSGETIQTVLNTAYPGQRANSGGGGLNLLFNEGINLLSPFKSLESSVGSNVCEAATFFSAGPLGLAICIYNMYKKKKADPLVICLIIPYIIILAYCVVGFPEFLAKITLLSHSTSKRALLGLGLINVILMIKGAGEFETKLKLSHSQIISLALAALLTFLTGFAGFNLSLKMYVFIFVVYVLFVFTIININNYKTQAALFLTAVCFMLGGMINPINFGTADVTNTDLARSIREYDEKDSRWVSDISYLAGNYLIMQGASTINSTNVYPDLKRWEEFDKDGKYNEVYNRYAHIQIHIVDKAVSDDRFSLFQADCIDISLSVNELKKMKVNRILTNRDDLESLSNKKAKVKLLGECSNYYIYEID